MSESESKPSKFVGDEAEAKDFLKWLEKQMKEQRETKDTDDIRKADDEHS